MARKILLADDSVTAQNMGRKILADAGYEVIAVNNGSAALKKILELKPDLVILDVYMPGYSGLEVCQRLKESQETARIPVLLTVGKLEPFKPEEAQRVRAEGFIVKPFEASELLSTLSKLEDKVVPRAEPSKPGRFARAIAAAEETGRGGRNDANEDTGWKSRIGFPKPRTEAEETIADEPAIYNPVNRDLRTTVETAEEKAAGKTAKEGPRRRAGEAAETSVDVAALAPAGLPKDVTPEEVAAIAAAAAQMQMVSAAIKPEPQVSEIETTGTTSAASSEPVSDKVESNLPRSEVRGDSASTADGEVKTETPQRSGTESEIKKVAGAAEAVLPSREEISEETRDVPVTLAATAESAGSANPAAGRWTAVAVALEGEEAAISLHQEMQKAHTDVVAPEADPTGGVGVTQAAGAENSSAGAEAAMEVPAAAISTPEPEPVREPERAMGAAQPEAEAAPAQADPVARLEAATVASSGAVAEPASQGEPANASSQPPEAVAATVPPEVEAEPRAETPSAASDSEPQQEPAAVAELVGGAVETEAATAAAETQELLPVAEAAPAMVEAASALSSAAAPVVRDAEPRLDPETVKSTAAAWASWQQVRDTGAGGEVKEPRRGESDVPEAARVESAAMAVAAGAEKIMQEASVATPSGDTNNVASIVDSVLADLRPKLMEEISRKISEKK